MTKKTTAVIIGRFQPLHNGHVNLIITALQDNDQVVLLMGSSNKELDFNNPFTNLERYNMIRNVFPAETYDSLHVVGVKDMPTEDQWVQEVVASVLQYEEDPSKVILYTSEKDEEFYDRTMMYNTCTIDSNGVSATDIRASLYDTLPFKDWYAIVPEENLSFLKEFSNNDTCFILDLEMRSCVNAKDEAIKNHKFANPIEPVCHAVVIHGADVLLVKRNSIRGYGQWAIPGGFMECDETTREAAVRELKEETGLDLTATVCKELAQAVEENSDDLSVRTIGINYLYTLDPNEDKPEVTIDERECLDYTWEPLVNVLEESTVLFYNHNVVVQRLISVYQGSQVQQVQQENKI